MPIGFETSGLTGNMRNGDPVPTSFPVTLIEPNDSSSKPFRVGATPAIAFENGYYAEGPRLYRLSDYRSAKDYGYLEIDISDAVDATSTLREFARSYALTASGLTSKTTPEMTAYFQNETGDRAAIFAATRSAMLGLMHAPEGSSDWVEWKALTSMMHASNSVIDNTAFAAAFACNLAVSGVYNPSAASVQALRDDFNSRIATLTGWAW